MAGDGWVVDIIWHTLILVANALANLWSNWSIEILLVVSFGMQLVLTVFAGFRWRWASRTLRRVIWLFYVGANYVATTALGHFSVSSAPGERQLVAFWAPIFLLHLGGPDSITAYALEDNELSKRYVLQLILQILGASYVVYKYISDNWTLVTAAWLMLLVGVAKYMEKVLALHRANLGNIRSSVENQPRRQAEGGRRYKKHLLLGGGGNDNSALLMDAHSLFHICKRAIVDSSNEMDSGDVADSRRTLFEHGWKDMYRVMEIELSLMYDFLYTKAAVIYTWHGYCIRVLSPLAAAVALLLVDFSHQHGHRQADVVITRIVLVATFLLETASLLRALGSSWTGFLLYGTRRWGWLHHQVLCYRRWHRFRRVVALGWLAKVEGHRRWSGRIGQHNLLQFSTREQPSRMAKEKVGIEDRSSAENIIVIPEDVKEEVFGNILEKLVELKDTIREGKEGVEAADMLKSIADSRTKRGQMALRKRGLYDAFRWSLGEELQEGILTWHIATDIYLFKSDIANKAGDTRVKAIRTLSNYMMFLLAKRSYMLPGLVLRRLYELTYEDLVRIWSEYGTQDDLEESSSSFWSLRITPWKLFESSTLRQRQERLARILCDEEHKFESDAVKSYLPSGIKLAKNLPTKYESLQLILEVWVEMLFYASYRCSRESHARQLSMGGELTTIVWLAAEHIGLFTINRKAKAAREDNWQKSKGTR